MAKVFKEDLKWKRGKLDGADGRPFAERWGFFCPGCYQKLKAMRDASQIDRSLGDDDLMNFSLHMMNVRDVHKYNGNSESPTFEPSIMARGTAGQCHSFVREGHIQFLSDCDHLLAGQTVPLPNISEEDIRKFQGD